MALARVRVWYVEDVAAIVRESADSTHCAVDVSGAMPRPEEFSGSISNAHSGSHFNGGFNRFWAEAVVKWLEEANLLAGR